MSSSSIHPLPFIQESLLLFNLPFHLPFFPSTLHSTFPSSLPHTLPPSTIPHCILPFLLPLPHSLSFIHSFMQFLYPLFKPATTQEPSRHNTDTVPEIHTEAPQATVS